MSAAQRIQLSDEVSRALAASEDINEAHRLMIVAADYWQEHHEPMTLADALEAVRRVAKQVEAIRIDDE